MQTRNPSHKPKRVASSLYALLLLLSPLCLSADLEVARDMTQLGEQARRHNLVILLSVSQDYCSYCERLKEEILQPMLISGEYTDKVLIRELLIDPGESVTDFAGKQRDASDFAGDYKVWVTPTLLYLGPDGTELSPRMLGVQTIEMYGYYVDESIDRALERLRDPQATPYAASRRDIGAWPEAWNEDAD